MVVSHCTITEKGVKRKPKTVATPKGKRKLKNPAHCSDDESGDENKKTQDEEGDGEEIFSCNLAVDPSRGFFYDFHWDAHWKSVSPLVVPDEEDASWGSGGAWNVAIREPRKSDKKRKKLNEDGSDVESKDEYQMSEDGEEEHDEVLDVEMEEDEDGDRVQGESLEEEVTVPRTPSKKRARHALSSPRKAAATPRKRTKTFAQPTPHSKAAAKRLQASPSKKKQKFTVRPLVFPSAVSEWNTALKKLPKDPWLRAMHMLHVGNRPGSLPCRDAEFENVLGCVGELLEEGSGGCVCECI